MNCVGEVFRKQSRNLCGFVVVRFLAPRRCLDCVQRVRLLLMVPENLRRSHILRCGGGVAGFICFLVCGRECDCSLMVQVCREMFSW